MHSPASANVPYGGPALESGTRYTWKVRAWDESGQPSAWSAPAPLETGLLTQADWTASWIGAPADDLNLSGARWIWFTNDDAVNNLPAMTRYLRTTVTLPSAPGEARFLFTVDDEAVVFVNGTQVIDTKTAARQRRERVAEGAAGEHRDHSCTPAPTRSPCRSRTGSTRAAAGRPRASSAGCVPARPPLDTSSAWKTSTTGPAGWEQPGFDDSAWTPARELATYGSGPWGSNVSLPPQPSPYLRKEFTATGPIASARLYVSALGLYEVRINGRKVGDEVLAPGWTEYSKRVPSQTYDVTDLLKPGANAIGAVLGDGWYAGRLQGGRKWGTAPALLAQLKLTYADGTTARIATDGSWQAGRGGLQATSIYDGEIYDARLDRPGWDEPELRRRLGQRHGAHRLARGRAHAVAADQASSRRSHPSSSRSRSPATYVYDLGQNFAGWARLRVQGPAGTTVRAALRRDPQRRRHALHHEPALRAADGQLTRCAAPAPRRPTSRASPTTASATSRSRASPARRRWTRSTGAWSAPTCPPTARSRAPIRS